MDVPGEVLVHNRQLGLKGVPGRLLAISSDGYFELNLKFGDNLHRALLPVGETVLISREAEEAPAPQIEIER